MKIEDYPPRATGGCLMILIVIIISLITSINATCQKLRFYFDDTDPRLDSCYLTMSVNEQYRNHNKIIRDINDNFYFEILNVYNEYKQYCYNDSSYNCRYKYITTTDYGNGITGGYEEYICEWIHKQPTFNDFMYYLWIKMEEKGIIIKCK